MTRAHIAFAVVAMVGGFLVVKAALKPKPIENPFPRESRAHVPYAEFAAKLATVPDPNRRLRNVTSAADASALGFEIAQNGLKRVDDAVLDRRLDLMIKMVEHLDLPTCAAMARADAAGAKKLAPKILRALENMPIEDIRAFFDLITKAVEAELSAKATPVTLTGANEIAMRNLAERFSTDERALLMRVIGFPNTVSHDSACWLIKTVFAEIKELPVKERYAVSRMLVQSANAAP